MTFLEIRILRPLFYLLPLFLLTIILAGCGNRGSGSDLSNGHTIISGCAFSIYPGLVKAYTLEPGGGQRELSLAETRTDNNGNYSLDLGQYCGPIIIKVSGQFHDYENNHVFTIAPDHPLHCAQAEVSGLVSLHITPLTEIAYSRAKHLGLDQPGNIEKAFSGFNTLFGLDLRQDFPVNIFEPEQSSQNRYSRHDRYGLILAGINRLARKKNINPLILIDNLAEQLSDTISSSSEEVPVAVLGQVMGDGSHSQVLPSPVNKIDFQTEVASDLINHFQLFTDPNTGDVSWLESSTACNSLPVQAKMFMKDLRNTVIPFLSYKSSSGQTGQDEQPIKRILSEFEVFSHRIRAIWEHLDDLDLSDLFGISSYGLDPNDIDPDQKRYVTECFFSVNEDMEYLRIDLDLYDPNHVIAAYKILARDEDGEYAVDKGNGRLDLYLDTSFKLERISFSGSLATKSYLTCLDKFTLMVQRSLDQVLVSLENSHLELKSPDFFDFLNSIDNSDSGVDFLNLINGHLKVELCLEEPTKLFGLNMGTQIRIVDGKENETRANMSLSWFYQEKNIKQLKDLDLVVSGKVSYLGRLSIENRPVINIYTVIESLPYQNDQALTTYSLQLDYAFADRYLGGEGQVLVFGESGKDNKLWLNLELQNQDGLLMNITWDEIQYEDDQLSGGMVKGNKKLADFISRESLPIVKYCDHTLETLF